MKPKMANAALKRQMAKNSAKKFLAKKDDNINKELQTQHAVQEKLANVIHDEDIIAEDHLQKRLAKRRAHTLHKGKLKAKAKLKTKVEEEPSAAVFLADDDQLKEEVVANNESTATTKTVCFCNAWVHSRQTFFDPPLPPPPPLSLLEHLNLPFPLLLFIGRGFV
jgi:hypothetical protein